MIHLRSTTRMSPTTESRRSSPMRPRPRWTRLFVDDAVEAYILARQHMSAVRGQVFNLGGFKDWVEAGGPAIEGTDPGM